MLSKSVHPTDSYKYIYDGFTQLAVAAGFEPVKVWMDEKHYFSVHCLRVV